MQPIGRKEVLDRLVSSRTLTPEGRDWLTLSLDPYHDYNHQAAGYPDSDASQTVVACYEYQYQLAAPAGAVANWDAHIFTTPLMATESMYVGSLNAGWSTFARLGTVQAVMGPLTIYASAAGGLLYPDGTTTPTTTVALPQGANASDLSFGITRVIGVGFEVTNTTADVNKQGSVTCYRMPTNPGRFQMMATNSGGTIQGAMTGYQTRAPPTTVQEALLLKGCVTWDAREGVYAVAAQHSVANPLANATTDGLLMTSQATGTTGPAVMGAFVAPGSQSAPAHSTLVPLSRKLMPFDTTGAFFMGLSNSTTLTVALRVYVERAPTQTESSLAVVATPSAPYDLAALELYSHAVSQLPIAVRVHENAAGDWWRTVVSVLSKVAIPMSMALTPWMPGAGLIGAGLAASAKTVEGVLARKAASSAEQVAVKQGTAKTSNTRKQKKKKANLFV